MEPGNPFDVPLRLVETVEDALELKRWLGEKRPILAVDCETEGLYYSQNKLRLVQVGDATGAWAIPFEDWKGFLRDTLNAYDGAVVGHNFKFDQHFLRHYAGVNFKDAQCNDTRIGAHLLGPDKRTGLKDLAVRYIHPHADLGEQALDVAMNKGNWNWATVPIQLQAYWAYGALDTVLTARLHELQEPQLHSGGLFPVYELECAVAQVLLRMEAKGARIDLPHCERERARLEVFADETRRWVQSTYGVGAGSNQAIAAVLLREGVELTKRTPKNTGWALDLEVLESAGSSRNAEGELVLHPLAQAVLNVRHSEKIAHSYFDNFLSMHDGDGVLHPQVNQLGARTGRMSVTNPALQTLPRDDYAVRDAFIPDEGNVLLTADYDQMEMRIFAHFANEEEMIRKIHGGIDLHTITAQAVYGLGDSKPSSRQRSIAKNANFCRIYGGGAKKFAVTAGIGIPEAENFYQMYNETFPQASGFMRQVEQVAMSRLQTEGEAYVRAPSGRRHPSDADHVYALVNYLIQGTCADIFKTRLVDLDRAGLGPYLELPVHDEVLMNVPSELAEEVANVVPGIMSDLTNWLVPLTVEVEGPLDRWGSKYRKKN